MLTFLDMQKILDQEQVLHRLIKLGPQEGVTVDEEGDPIKDITLPWPMILFTCLIRWGVEEALVLMDKEAEVEVSVMTQSILLYYFSNFFHQFENNTVNQLLSPNLPESHE